MKNSLLCVLLVSAIFSVNAQTAKNVEKGLFKVNALLPGVSYELGVGKNATFNFEATLFPYAEDNSTFGSNDIDLEIYPALGADFRYFLNMGRRLRKGKDISMNSGNYVAFENQLVVGAPILGNIETDTPLGFSIGIVYGIQRTYGKGFYWGLSFGPKVFAIDDNYYSRLSINPKIGWVIGNR